MTDAQMFTPGILEEYDILKLALTYYDELEASLRRPIQEYIAKHPEQKEIKVIEPGFGTLIITDNILAAGENVVVYGFDPDIGMFENAERVLRERVARFGG